MDENIESSHCEECNGGDETQLKAEVEHLRQHLSERDGHLVALEAEFHKCSQRVNDLEEQVDTWREKYERLYDSHKRVQKLNQVLEDKLLQMVDKIKSEKGQLTKDIATLSVRLAESKYNYSMLQKENERYKNDMNLAIQLLQCKPDNFVSQKLDNLSVDTQARVSQYVMSKTSKSGSMKNGNDNDASFDASEYEFNISASLMTKILEDSIQDSLTKHCDSCTCTKLQAKPFCYAENYFSVGTQTVLTGEMKNSLCLNCNAEIKSVKSELSLRSMSPHGIRLVNDKNIGLTGPLYIIPQPEPPKETSEINLEINTNTQTCEKPTEEMKPDIAKNATKVEEDASHFKKSNVSMEPAVHHKLCDRTKTYSMSSKKSSNSIGQEDVTMKDVTSKESIPKSEQPKDNISLRKNSHSSMGAVSRTSSIAKSTVSTHKSGTHVGPGPRFCHLRMQAGSKNILLDNAEPDVPPVLYRRQSKCNENPIFKDLNDGMDNFIDLEKDNESKDDIKNDNVVVESTLIDVHVDNNNRDFSTASKMTPINPVLMNVSSSPLQPQKTHNFSGSSENNNNHSQSLGSQQNCSEIDNLLEDFTPDLKNSQNNNHNVTEPTKIDILTPTDNHDVKIFNFDRYEQSKVAGQFSRHIRKIDMAQLHSLENTKISKDCSVKPGNPKSDKNLDISSKVLPTIVNVYPNLTQTHLKVNESKKVFTNEQSTSSLSSDDSAAILQKQQLLRVAEWVEQNLEQQNIFSDPLEDEVNFSNMVGKKDSKLSRLTATLNELALNMPHPVSKYSKPYTKDEHNNWAQKSTHGAKIENHHKIGQAIPVHNVTKVTAFPADGDLTAITEVSNEVYSTTDVGLQAACNNLRELQSKSDKEISPEDLARMEYNVKKFLLSGPQWVSESTRSRRTSSKTETDV